MHKLFYKSVLVMLTGIAALLITVLPTSAHSNIRSASQTGTIHVQSSGIKCHTLLVHLNGKRPATTTCLDGHNTYGTNCAYHNALLIAWDANLGGPKICFVGTGFADMGQYCNWFWFGCVSWNDQASSYNAGCSSGIFYKDSNGNGQQQAFNPQEAGAFDGQNGHLPNDSLSSFQIFNNC